MLKYTFALDENLFALQDALQTGQYTHGDYHEFMVTEPKERKIRALPFPDRVLQHAVYSVIEPLFDKKFYVHSYACRHDKGGHAASSQLKSWLYQAHRRNIDLYCLKCDVRKFFNSVDLQILYEILKKKIKDKKLLWLFRRILDLPNETIGLPIGNLTSQLFANIFLNEIDKYIVNEIRPAHYIRYMDDFLLLDANKAKLQEARSYIEIYLRDRLHLDLNLKVTRLFPVRMGVEFVGYVHWHNYTKVRKRTWKREKANMKRSAKKLLARRITKEKFVNIYASINGNLQHADAYKTQNLMNIFKLQTILKYDKIKN
ncbi:MAG: hypothetical protein LBQ97_02690 [Fusobacteriaceae bacterium]|nr:hypothetical protein [Fusobacteriaceae bacterium]